MNHQLDFDDHYPFDAETWAQLPAFLEQLPEPVCIQIWGDENASQDEQETVELCRTLARHFHKIRCQVLPRRENYPYYPVLGFMGEAAEEVVDYGVRIIGWPTGYQLTSLITAIQVVSFRGMTLEPMTRIKLHGLAKDVSIEVLTSADNETGAIMAKIAFGLAVASPHVRAYLIMTDRFPEAAIRYSAYSLPHMVINNRVHIEGVVDENMVVKHIAEAVKDKR